MGIIFDVRRPEAEGNKINRSYLPPGQIWVIPDFTATSLGYLGILCDPREKLGKVFDLDEEAARAVDEEGEIDPNKLDDYPLLLTLGLESGSGEVSFKPEPEEAAQIVIRSYEPNNN